MNTKSKTPSPEKKAEEKDFDTFEQLPENTKELMQLKEYDERTIGSDQIATTRKIDKAVRSEKKT